MALLLDSLIEIGEALATRIRHATTVCHLALPFSLLVTG